MEVSGPGKSPNTTLSFRYNANNEELEELFNTCDDDPPTPQCDLPSAPQSENPSPKRGDKTPSIIDKYFKSIRTEKSAEKGEKDEVKVDKPEEGRSSTPKEISSSPMKEYLNRLSKRSTPDSNTDVKENTNETWKIFHDFKFKIAQAVEDMKTRSLEETKEKSVPRDNSMSDSEENSAVKDVDQQSVGDTDNQVSSLESSIQNLSDITQPLTAKVTERELSLPIDNKNSSDSDDTHKNLVYSEMVDERDFENDIMMDVESGVEAMEETMDGFGDVSNANPEFHNVDRAVDSPDLPYCATPTNFRPPPSKSNLKMKTTPSTTRTYFLNFTMYFLTIFLIVNYLLFPDANVWNGFLLGIWFFCLVSNIKHWLLDTYFSEWEPQKGSFFQVKRTTPLPIYTIPSVKEHQPLKKYDGWINHYRFPDYDPYTYHINKTTTAFMKLEGCNLRISYTRTKVAKRALWDEKIDKVVFYQHRLYNLTGARVILLPKGLVARRQWSKKYPICVILNEKEKIQVLEKENATQAADRKASEQLEKKRESTQFETESTETGTSPEKKKKFVWRRRDKSISHAELPGTPESGKEGLRHRLVRKMHRDKKPDSVSTGTEPPDQSAGAVAVDESRAGDEAEAAGGANCSASRDELEDDFDDNELTKIKEFLEEAESEADGTVEGEWSVRFKQPVDKHSHLFLFGRTGRDKHEWFRRLSTAISEANASAESSASDDKSPADAHEGKDGIELAVYKMTEKETVAFAKSSNKNVEPMSEGVTITSLSQPISADSDNYEKNFWPYLLKILQSKHAPAECACRSLPAEVTWVNTALARIFYDVMRDPLIIARVQNRIQRKLNTLKLPSFMSPLTVDSLSLSGACPLVERVCPVSWDARGVWLDADLRYSGGAYIALSTQINLMKLKEKNVTLEDQMLAASDNVVENDMHCSLAGALFSEKLLRRRKPAIYDSEVEDSAESSSDDESSTVHPIDSTEFVPVAESNAASGPKPSPSQGGSSKKKILRMVDKIATNKYFQQVTDYKYVKRAMEGLSNTDIKLHLEIHGLEGRLAVNLPPPPHDRIWIGFRTNPQLVLKARPAVGARTLRFAHISNWIEQKLSKEFEKVLVLPNMEDIVVDVMTPTPVHFE